MTGNTLRALGAVLLCWASWVGLAVAGAAPVAAPALPPVITATGDWGIPLYGRSLVWVDEVPDRRIEQLEASASGLPWQLRTRNSGERLRGRAAWVQFEARVPAGERWLLEIDSAVYDRVQLFYRDRAGKWVEQEAGTTEPVAFWSVPGRVPTFELARDPQPVRYWLRIVDDRADLSATLRLWREDRLQAGREREQFLYGAYFGLAALVAAAALANGLAFRDRSFLAYALYILFLGAGQLGRAGIGAQHLWRDWPVWSNATLALWPGAATAAGLWFAKVLTEPARLSRALDLGAWALIAALLAAVALDIAIGTPSSTMLVLTLTGLSLAAILGMVLWGWLDGTDASLRIVAAGFVPTVLMALFPLGAAFGLMANNLLTRSGLFFASVLQLPVLYYALNMRLMARREGEARARALDRTDALTGLPHRQALIERLDSSLAHARGQKQQCALLGVRISNLDAIVEEFGQDAAEKALVVAASHLRRTSVDYDMAARVGEREFALLLEAPITPPAATSRAQQVVANGLRPIDSLPAALILKFHVTIAMLPLNGADGAGSLQVVIDGLDQITPDARKLIRPLNL